MRSLWYASAALWLAAVCASLADAQRACTQQERCVELEQCPELAPLLVGNRQPSTAEANRLQKAHCGFQGRKAKVCCALLPNYSDCGPTPLPDKIINGNETRVMEFPWAVRLGYRYNRRINYQCGGALISNRYVLTAAHCTETKRRPVTVRLGEHDASKEEDCSVISNAPVCAPPVVDVAVEKIIAHEGFVKDTRSPDYLRNDIALLRLAEPVTYSDAVKPVCLPIDLRNDKNQQAREMANFLFSVVGWGKINRDVDDQETSDVLLKLNLRLVKHSECESKYGGYTIKPKESGQVCAIAKNGADVCRGDSGGPLSAVQKTGNNLVRSVLRGLVSFGPTVCATNGMPAIFTRVEHYLPWIMRNLRP